MGVAQMLKLQSTVVEQYMVENKGIYVKRDDLCVASPYPALAKMRGLPAYLKRLAEAGVKRVGVLESAVSQVGVALAMACQDIACLESYVFLLERRRGASLGRPRKLADTVQG